MSDAQKLTKKQKKAQAFRSTKGKGKGKDDGEVADVPDVEDLDAAEGDEGGDVPVKKASKKRKLDDAGDAAEGEPAEEGEGERKKKRQRGKKKSQQNSAIKPDGTPRLLLFAGNLPYKVTVEAVQQHFANCGETPIVRLLTPRPNPAATVSKSKGCAFLEFTHSNALQAALRLHQSDLGGRKINVELTAGGGGNSEARKTKIVEGRKKLEVEREKATTNRKAREEQNGGSKDKASRWQQQKATTEGPEVVVAEVSKDDKPAKAATGKKVRDRRIPKTDSEGVVKERVRKQEARRLASTSGANTMPLGAK